MNQQLTLHRRIETELRSYHGMMGIYIDDLHGNVVKMHEKEVFETASTIKVFILACLFDKVEKKQVDIHELLEYKPDSFVDGSGIIRSLSYGVKLPIIDVATLMIIVSDNIATNMLISYLGIDEINSFIAAAGFQNTKLHNKLDFEKYDQLGSTTPEDYGSIFVKIAKGELINQQASEKMLGILKGQHYNTMLTKNFPQEYLDYEDLGEEQLISVASKSGSMRECRNDGGIVTTPYGKYIIVLLNKAIYDPVYYSEHPAIEFGAKVSRLVLDQYLALEGRLVK